MLACLTLLPGGGFSMEGLAMEGFNFSSETTDHQQHQTSLTPHSSWNYKAMLKTEKQIILNAKAMLQSATRKPGVLLWKDSEALLTLVVGIIKAELSQCILAIVWDSVLVGSVIIESLSSLPNVKQVCHGEIFNVFLHRA